MTRRNLLKISARDGQTRRMLNCWIRSERFLPRLFETMIDGVIQSIEAISAECLISVRPSDGAIIWDSSITRKYPIVDVDVLLMSVEDNITVDDDIDWRGVIDDYRVNEGKV